MASTARKNMEMAENMVFATTKTTVGSGAAQGFLKTCRCCGREFRAPTNNTMNCPECKKALRKQQSMESYQRFLAREDMRRVREKVNRGDTAMEKEKDGVPVGYWSAALNMLAWNAGMSYGKIQVWARFHGEEYQKWMHELKQCYRELAAEKKVKKGIVILPNYVPESLPKRQPPQPCEWSGERHRIRD